MHNLLSEEISQVEKMTFPVETLDDRWIDKNPELALNIEKKVLIYTDGTKNRISRDSLSRETPNQPYSDDPSNKRKTKNSAFDISTAVLEDSRERIEGKLNTTINTSYPDLTEGHHRECTSTSSNCNRSLMINGFIRPLLVSSVKKLIAETGTIEGFWMDRIKSFCYVILSTPHEAMTTLKVVQGLKFPNERTDRLTLSAKYVSMKEAKDVIDGKVNPRPSIVQFNCYGYIKRDLESSRNPIDTIHHFDTTSTHRFPLIKNTSNEKVQSEFPNNIKCHFLTSSRPSTNSTPTLDKLFKKTISTPRIYWLPASEDQVKKNKEIGKKATLN